MKLTDRYPIGLLLIVVLGCGEDTSAPMPPPIDPVMPVPAGIRVTPSELVLRTLGQTAQLTATLVDANGNAIPGTVSATWSTADMAVATVSSMGLVTATGNGSTEVTAVVDSFTGKASVEVADASQDREALVRLYHATGGPDWRNSANWLSSAPLSEWFGIRVGPNGRVDGIELQSNGLVGTLPPELGNLENLVTLLLTTNQLTGSIPPELGKLFLLERLEATRNQFSGPLPPELGGMISLRRMHLGDNDLSGPLPSEIGNLDRLEYLGLAWNPGLRGLLPRSLLNLAELRSFYAYQTDLCLPVDDAFDQWLDRFEEAILNDCSPDQVRRLALSEFFELTGGESWNNASGWNTDADVGDWYGITSEAGSIRSISLSDNGLTGPLPAVIGGFGDLEILDLGGNDLAGDLPVEIGQLGALTTLRLDGNEGLEGYFPFSVTGLAQLEVLQYEGTNLCIPPTPGFEAWLEHVDSVDGALCDLLQAVRLGLPTVYLTQAIQRPAGDVPIIAGRDALLRVFLTSDAPNAFYQPEAVATFSLAGAEVYRTTLAPEQDIRKRNPALPTFVDESDLSRSYNAVIPGEHLQPGLQLVVEVDPDGALPLADNSERRYPASGLAAVDVVEVPPMNLTVVPVVETSAGDTSIYSWTRSIADDSWQVGLLRYAFPFSEFRARSRATYTTSLDLSTSQGQWELILELEAVRAAEGGTGYWYGTALSRNGYVRGRARLGGPVSMGKPTVPELAHEIGHNLDLQHAPCGNALETDPGFPHHEGSIGAWGYDFRDSTLVSPTTRRDIMGYCYWQGWLSDYYFEKVISHRASAQTDVQTVASRSHRELLVVSGGVLGGALQIKPAFRATATERLPNGPGPYRIQGFAGDALEFSFSFTPGEDQFGDKYFLFMVPSGDLDQITLTGPEGTVTIGPDDGRTTTVIRDPSSGLVRGILADWQGDLPAAVGRIVDVDVTTYGPLGDERERG